jgi:predicted RNA-binding Zn ribbon-like protein
MMELDMRQGRTNDRANPFEWNGGHPALDLVNTLDERPSPAPIENLATYRDLTRFAELAGLVDRRTTARLLRLAGRSGSPIVKRARKLREHLHDVLAAANSGRPARQLDLDALSVAIRAAHSAQIMVASPSPGLASRRWSPSLSPEIPLHACSLAIERLLLDEERRKIRKCEAADCDVYYLDSSKGQRRQWCSMKGCGNREKQRRWRSAG